MHLTTSTWPLWLCSLGVFCLVAAADEPCVPPSSEHSTPDWQLGASEDWTARVERLEAACQHLSAENEWLRREVDDLRPSLSAAAAVASGTPEFSPSSFDTFSEAPVREASPPKVTEVGKDLAFKAGWRNGLTLETGDKAFRMNLGGRVHLDTGWWLADPSFEAPPPAGVGPLLDGATFRRARFRTAGQMYEVVQWFMEIGFETGSPVFFDVWGELPRMPIGSLRIGHFREPFSMDALTSGNSLMLMERSLAHDALVPFRNTGVMLYDTAWEQSASWAVGAFRTNSNSFGSDAGDGDYAGTGRVTWNPWYQQEGRYAVHFGAGYSYRVLPELNALGIPVATGGLRRVRLATRPEIRINSPNFLDTGLFPASREQLFGLEFGVTAGRWLLQSEWMGAVCQDAVTPVGSGVQTFFQGCYVQGSCFLTGENRPYVRSSPGGQGIFGQVIPYENFFWLERGDGPGSIRGRGAWELALRYSWLDLRDSGIDGGQQHDLTTGLNWYLNPSCRWMLNGIAMWRDGPSDTGGTAGILATRCQVDF